MLRFKNSLVWKLTIWFLLLAIFPIVVMTVFVRQNIQEELFQLADEDIQRQVGSLSERISAMDDPSQLERILTEASGPNRAAFLLGADGSYAAPTDPALAGSPNRSSWRWRSSGYTRPAASPVGISPSCARWDSAWPWTTPAPVIPP